MRTGSRFAGRRWLAVAVIVAAMLLPALTVSADTVIIDSFDAGTQSLQAEDGITPTAGSTAIGLTGILGMQRDTQIEWLSGGGVASARIDTGGGGGTNYLDFSHTGLTTGRLLLQWDGPDQSINLIANGLAPVDFTGGGTNDQIEVRILSNDLPATVRARAYCGSSANYREATSSTPGGINSGSAVAVSFSLVNGWTAVGTCPDLTAVTAFELLITATTDEVDLVIDSIVVSGNREYGDLPDGYPVTLAENGARHITLGPRLGTNVDVEPDGVHSAAADHDDVYVGLNPGSPDDEDGVTRADGMSPGTRWTNGTVSSLNGGAVNVNIQGETACLGAMFNFANSGTTLTLVTLRNSSGVAVTQPIAPGSYTFYFDIDAGTFVSGTPRSIFSRFRVTRPVQGACSDPAAAVAFSPTGEASTGEIEDHRFNFGPNAVTLTDLQATTVSTGGRLMEMLRSWLQR